jgi:undecaprenyl-diphosphatase
MHLGLTPDSRAAADAFAIVIQFGAILAVLGLYWPFCLRMLKGVIGRDDGGRRLLIRLLAAFVPAAVVGKLFDEKIESLLFGLWPVACAWIAGGIFILVVCRGWRGHGEAEKGDELDGLSVRQAVTIGLCQCFALWPGVSRSLSTIVGGRLVGLSMRPAVIFSFLLGVMTLSAATLYKGIKQREVLLEQFGASSIGIGMAFALISAVISVKWMVGYLNRHGLALFGWYRIVLGLVVLLALATNRLTA